MRNIKREIKVGITVTLSLVLLIWGINFLKGINILRSSRNFYAKYDRIEGLSTSSPVLVNGFKIGTVQEIRFHPKMDGSILVKFTIGESSFQLPAETMAKITSLDLLGSKCIVLDLPLNVENNWEEKGFLQSGDTLRSDVERSLTDEVNAQIAPLKKKAEDLLASIDTAVTFIKVILNKEARTDIRESFSSIKNTFLTIELLSKRLDSATVQEKEKISAMLTNLQSITFNIRNNNENITAILDNFRLISDSLVASNLATAVNNASKALTAAAGIMQRIENGEGTMGMLINNDTLYNNLSSAAADLDKLLIDLEAHPKRYVHFSLFGRKDTKSRMERKAERKNEKDQSK